MVKQRNKRLVHKMSFILLVIMCLVFITACDKKMVYYPKQSNELLINPMTGFAPWGKNKEYVTEEHSLVYVDLTWREWEPKQDFYDYETFESSNNLQQWREEGKRIVFRFVCDRPDEESHMDIPDWLYEMTGGNGDNYNTDYGKGYAPDYADPIFMERHELAIKALAERYSKDDFFCFIELGSLGHWGEWHVKYEDGISRMPKADIRDQYVMHYIKYFSNTKLMMRRPFAIAAREGLGLFNDMTGDKAATDEWLYWIKNGGEYEQAKEGKDALLPMEEAWMVSPIGGEFTSSISMDEIIDQQLDTTLNLLRRSHTTFIGPKAPVNEENGSNYTEEIHQILSLIGYRLRIEKLEYTILSRKKGLIVHMDWVNDGIAPLYYNWETKLYLLNQDGTVIKEELVDIDLTKVLPEVQITTETILDISGLDKGKYQLALAIIDPISEKPAIAFAMEGISSSRLFVFDTAIEY